MLAAGILFTAVDLARCDCVAQGAQASRGFGAAARDRRSAATRIVFGLALQAALFGARNAQTAGAACSFEYCGLSDTPAATADAMRAPRSGCHGDCGLLLSSLSVLRGASGAVLRADPPFGGLRCTPGRVFRTLCFAV